MEIKPTISDKTLAYALVTDMWAADLLLQLTIFGEEVYA